MPNVHAANLLPRWIDTPERPALAWNRSAFPRLRRISDKENAMVTRSLIVAIFVATLISPAIAFAQGSAGTGNTSTGLGAPFGPAGPGIRGGGWTQQPGAATNTTSRNLNLTPAERNSMPPPNVLPRDTRGYRR